MSLTDTTNDENDKVPILLSVNLPELVGRDDGKENGEEDGSSNIWLIAVVSPDGVLVIYDLRHGSRR